MSSAAVAGAVAASALAATVLNRKYKISTDLGFLRTLVSIKLGCEETSFRVSVSVSVCVYVSLCCVIVLCVCVCVC